MKSFLLCLGVWSVSTITFVASVFAAPDDFPTLVPQNWHQWRGPQATGVAANANPPLEWSETSHVKWKVKIPGESTATPIVWGDQIFLITAVKTDRTIELPPVDPKAPKTPFNIQKPANYYQFVVMCVDRKTGQTRWQQTAKEEVPHEGRHHDASFASASPMTDGSQLFVSFGSRGVYCYDMAGTQKWTRDLGRMTIYNSFGEGSSPVVRDDSVVVNWDHQGGSFITVLDARTGETKWKVDRDENTSWATPLVIDHKGRTQVIVHGGKRVRSYDLKSGELIWACGGMGLAAIPCPVTDGKNVFVMTGYMGNACFAIPLDSEGDITEFATKAEPEKIAWKRTVPGTPYVPSPLLYGELLYYTASNKGILSCINAATGEPLMEKQRIQGVENIYCSPVAAADRIYFTSREGNTVVIKKGPELEILATNKLDDRFDASAAIVGNEIILRGREYLYCISAE